MSTDVVVHLGNVSTLLKRAYFRDRLGKILQYGYKYWAWKAAQDEPADAKHYSSVSSTLSLGRKMYRMLRWVHDLESVDRMSPIRGDMKDVLRLVELFASCNYWVYDNLYWLTKSGVRRTGDAAHYRKMSVAFWLVILAFRLRSLYQSWRKACCSEDNGGDRVALVLRTIQVLSDTSVCVQFNVQTGTLPSFVTPHDGLIGAAGVLSGVAGVVSEYRGLM